MLRIVAPDSLICFTLPALDIHPRDVGASISKAVFAAQLDGQAGACGRGSCGMNAVIVRTGFEHFLKSQE